MVYSADNIGAGMRQDRLEARFRSGAKVKFAHLEHEVTKFDHKGGQYPFIGFDELTGFSKSMFMYLLTRNRPATGCKIRPYWRATTNPDSESWVRQLLDWWIDPDTGYAIPERSGVIRYYTVEDNEIVWVPKEYRDQNGQPPKSFTFIPSSIDDNPAGMEADPNYKSTLQAQDRVTREQLLHGNWNITPKGGMFNADWFEIVNELPIGIKQWRYWDLACTPEDEEKKNDPDYTSGAKGFVFDGYFYITDVRRKRDNPGVIETWIADTASHDSYDTKIAIEEEHGSSGRYTTDHFIRHVLNGFMVFADRVVGKKTERAKPWAALAEHGYVRLLKGAWNNAFLSEAAGFPLGKRDQVDSVSGLFKMLTTHKPVFPDYRPSPQLFRPDFSNINKLSTLLSSVWIEPSGELSCILALWRQDTGSLFVFDELEAERPSAVKILVELVARIRALSGNHEQNMRRFEWYANAEALSKHYGGSIQEVYAKYNIYVRPNDKYEESSAILCVERLMQRKRLFLHVRVKELSRQLSAWPLTVSNSEDGIAAGRPAKEGYGMARALCNVVSLLWETGAEIVKPSEYKQYSPKHTNRLRYIEDKARQGQHHVVLAEDYGIPTGEPDGGWMV